MPAERRSFTAARLIKSERTHDENQERAYIAASRRSDRDLEARIESARKASEVRKKRTGRALRVTEEDVFNEVMYEEEEEEDLPTQNQRLNAHLHTTSVMFNKKLHDYIATQHRARNMFMSQYRVPQYQQYGGQSPPHNNAAVPQANNWLSPTMMPRQFNQSTLPNIEQQPQPPNPKAGRPQGFPLFMADSEHLAQPFAPTYTYNPNYSPKAMKPGSSMTISLPQTGIKSESATESGAPISSSMYTNEWFLTPGIEDYGVFFDFLSTDIAQPGDEQNSNNDQLVDSSSFVN